MATRPVPEGFHSITPYLSVTRANEAIDFYKRAFGAVEAFRLSTPEGGISHADLMIGDSHIMLSDPCEESPIPSPDALDGSTIGLYLYVEDADALFSQAVEAGAAVLKPVEDQFYGDRSGTLKDPYGHIWFIGTHKEDLSLDEIQARAAAMLGGENA